MKLPHQSRGRTPGFTLIELMVVIILIGIMAAMIVPEMHGTYEDALLRSASRELVDVFSIASSRAVSQNELHRVRLDHKTGRYLMERKAGEDEPAAPSSPEGFVPVQDVPGSEGRIDNRISILIRKSEEATADGADRDLTPAGEEPGPVESDQTIAFYPDGTADGVEILLQDRDGFQRLLRINSTTARVSIVDSERTLATALPEGGTE